MIVWDILNAVGRLAVAAIIVWKLTRWPHLFNACERWGMSIGAGAALMTIPALWAPAVWLAGERGPFGGWASTAFTWAMLVYFVGRLARYRRLRATRR